MIRLGHVFGSSIGRKILIAATGVILIGFAIIHLAGNLLVFRDADVINGYAQFLHALGPALWIARLMLLASLGIHVWAVVALALENVRARGPQPLKATWLEATFQSRTMKSTGVVVLLFIIYHLAHFTFGSAQADSFKGNLAPYVMQADFRLMGFLAVRAGEEVPDVHTMIVRGFQPPLVSAFYVLSIGLLSLHMLHGIESGFQTFGWSQARWTRRLRVAATVFCLAYLLGNISIPAGIYSGVLKPHAGRVVVTRAVAAAAE